MSLLKDNLEPTDFADAVCKLTEWKTFSADHAPDTTGYRIWICRCGKGHWFQRHEWSIAGQNQTHLDDWIYNGYNTNRTFKPHENIDYSTIRDL